MPTGTAPDIRKEPAPMHFLLQHALAPTMILACGLALSPPTAEAQTLRERMQQGKQAAQEGFGKAMTGASNVMNDAAGRIDETVASTTNLMVNEPTPEATRAELDSMASETMNRLFAERPGARTLLEQSAGFAVFDTRKVVLFGFAAGAGRGVAIAPTPDPVVIEKYVPQAPEPAISEVIDLTP
jgi:hypothetical protein